MYETRSEEEMEQRRILEDPKEMKEKREKLDQYFMNSEFKKNT